MIKNLAVIFYKVLLIPVITYFSFDYIFPFISEVFGNGVTTDARNIIYFISIFVIPTFLILKFKIKYKYTLLNILIYFILVFIFCKKGLMDIDGGGGWIDITPTYEDAFIFAVCVFILQSMWFGILFAVGKIIIFIKNKFKKRYMLE